MIRNIIIWGDDLASVAKHEIQIQLDCRYKNLVGYNYTNKPIYKDLKDDDKQ